MQNKRNCNKKTFKAGDFLFSRNDHVKYTKTAESQWRCATEIEQQTKINKKRNFSVNSSKMFLQISRNVIDFKDNFFKNTLFDETNVKQILEKLDTNKTCAPDYVGNLILKKTNITLILNWFQNCSLRGPIPDRLENLWSRNIF